MPLYPCTTQPQYTAPEPPPSPPKGGSPSTQPQYTSLVHSPPLVHSPSTHTSTQPWHTDQYTAPQYTHQYPLRHSPGTQPLCAHPQYTAPPLYTPLVHSPSAQPLVHSPSIHTSTTPVHQYPPPATTTQSVCGLAGIHHFSHTCPKPVARH